MVIVRSRYSAPAIIPGVSARGKFITFEGPTEVARARRSPS